MAYFYRLIVSLFLLSSCSAFALIPTTTGSGVQYGGWGVCSTDRAAQCASLGPFHISNPEGDSCVSNNGPSGGTFYPYSCAIQVCPANSTLSGQSCVCTLPYKENSAGTACEMPCDPPKQWIAIVTDSGSISSCGVQNCKAGPVGSGLWVTKARLPSGDFPPTSYECVAGCVTKTKYDMAVGYTDASGVVHDDAVGETLGMGSSCMTQNADSSTAQKPAPLDSKTNPNSAKTSACPSGQVPRVVNGQEVCGPVGSDVETVTKSKESSTDADGNKVDKETTTTCVGGTCTSTTKTTKTPAGGEPSDETKTDTKDKTKFCEENPNLSVCKEGSFSGSCDAPPACKGDAIQCAVAAQTLKTACALDPKDNGEAAAFEEAKSKTGSQIGDLPGNDSVSIGSSSFDTTDAIGAGSCIADMLVTVAGSSITIPFSKVCSSLAILGNLLMMVSFLLAGRIVVRG